MLAGENFGEFGNLLRIRQSFICQLLVISEKAIEAGLKFAKVFFAKYNLACNSPKFSPAKIFCYTVIYRGEYLIYPCRRVYHKVMVQYFRVFPFIFV